MQSLILGILVILDNLGIFTRSTDFPRDLCHCVKTRTRATCIVQYLMIHDMHKSYLDLDLDQYRLTFDDGLFSQYYYFPLYKDHPEGLIFFIATGFIQPGEAHGMFDGSYLSHLKSKKYMYRSYVEKKFDHFMTTDEIRELAAQPNVEIGVHSHWHDIIPTATHPRKRKPLSEWKLARFDHSLQIVEHDLSIRSKIAFQGYHLERGELRRRTVIEWEDYIKRDTDLCLQWVADNLGFTPKSYCFPFNEHNQKVVGILKTYGLKKFFAARPGESRDVVGRKDIDSLIYPP